MLTNPYTPISDKQAIRTKVCSKDWSLLKSLLLSDRLAPLLINTLIHGLCQQLRKANIHDYSERNQRIAIDHIRRLATLGVDRHTVSLPPTGGSPKACRTTPNSGEKPNSPVESNQTSESLLKEICEKDSFSTAAGRAVVIRQLTNELRIILKKLEDALD